MVVVVFGVELPYGTAFKLVTVLGVLALPVCAYAFGRLADLPFPGPALLSVASVLFLFDRNFTIYGGNIASTLAGEFAFSISLSLALLYLGVVIRGLRTGRAPRPRGGAPGPHRALPPDPGVLRHRRPPLVIARRCGDPAKRTAIWLACVLPVAGLLERLLGAAVLVAARLRERHGLGEAARTPTPRTTSGR